MPRVSVIVPVFNPGEGMLARSVSSVLSQTVSDVEVIVVDDGSMTEQGWVAGLDPRIRFIQQPNRGVSIARNVAARAARADLIAFLDHDDEWLPHKLEEQLQLVASHPEAAFWCTGFIWNAPDGELPAPGLQDPTYLSLLRADHVCNSSVLVRTDAYWEVGGSNPLRRISQDCDLFMRLCMEGKDAAIVTTPLVRYYLHDSNATRNYWAGATARLEILAQHERRAQRINDGDALTAIHAGRARLRELYAYQAIDAARSSLRAHDSVALLRHLSRTYRLSPRIAAHALSRTILRRISGHR